MTPANGVALSQAQSGSDLDLYTGTNPAAVAKAFKASGLFPDLASEAQAFVKVMAGRELGIGPMASMMGVNVIQGKVTLSANLMAAQVKSSGTYNYLPREMSAEVCRLEFFQNGDSIGVSEFSMEDAQRAGLVRGTNWQKYPKAMLFARALSQGVRWYCPDVLSGSPAYVPEEMGASVTEDGEVDRDGRAHLRRTDDDYAEQIIDAQNARAEQVDHSEEVEAEVTISRAEAGRIFDEAKTVTSIDPDRFAQAIAFVSKRGEVDVSTKKAAVEVLSTFTEADAKKLADWIERNRPAESEETNEETDSNE